MTLFICHDVLSLAMVISAWAKPSSKWLGSHSYLVSVSSAVVTYWDLGESVLYLTHSGQLSMTVFPSILPNTSGQRLPVLDVGCSSSKHFPSTTSLPFLGGLTHPPSGFHRPEKQQPWGRIYYYCRYYYYLLFLLQVHPKTTNHAEDSVVLGNIKTNSNPQSF